MSDTQSDKDKKATARYIVIMGGIGTAIALAHIAWIGSFFVLEYAALALGLFALIGGSIMMVAQKPKA
jgi:hypothetical protein